MPLKHAFIEHQLYTLHSEPAINITGWVWFQGRSLHTLVLLKSEARPVSIPPVSTLAFQQPLERRPRACGVSHASADMRAFRGTLGVVPATPWLPSLVPSPIVLNSQQPLGLELFLLFFSSSMWAKLLTTAGAVGLVPGCQGPLPAGGGGQAQAGGVMAERTSVQPSGGLLSDLPSSSQREWELLGPWLQAWIYC